MALQGFPIAVLFHDIPIFSQNRYFSFLVTTEAFWLAKGSLVMHTITFSAWRHLSRVPRHLYFHFSKWRLTIIDGVNRVATKWIWQLIYKLEHVHTLESWRLMLKMSFKVEMPASLPSMYYHSALTTYF